jgi:deazaflavin-dependent oxidoreductase (nitroreductase family)
MSASDIKEVLQDKNEVDLTVTGRRSGEESTRTIWFVEEPDRMLLLPVSGSDSNWYRNIEKTPDVRLAANGAELSATARPIDDAAKVADVVEKFRGKYGADQVAEYYPKQNAAVEVPLD